MFNVSEYDYYLLNKQIRRNKEIQKYRKKQKLKKDERAQTGAASVKNQKY